VPSVVQFGNGQTVVVPQLGEPESLWITRFAIPRLGDRLVIRRWCLHRPRSSRRWAERFVRSCWETGFVKLDRVLTSHQHLSARLSTSR
jgi:hypothetical protein